MLLAAPYYSLVKAQSVYTHRITNASDKSQRVAGNSGLLLYSIWEQEITIFCHRGHRDHREIFTTTNPQMTQICADGLSHELGGYAGVRS